MALVSWDEVAPVVSPYEVESQGLACYRLAFDTWPEELAAFLLGTRREPAAQLNGIGLDQVLVREWVEETGQA